MRAEASVRAAPKLTNGIAGSKPAHRIGDSTKDTNAKHPRTISSGIQPRNQANDRHPSDSRTKNNKKIRHLFCRENVRDMTHSFARTRQSTADDSWPSRRNTSFASRPRLVVLTAEVDTLAREACPLDRMCRPMLPEPHDHAWRSLFFPRGTTKRQEWPGRIDGRANRNSRSSPNRSCTDTCRSNTGRTKCAGLRQACIRTTVGPYTFCTEAPGAWPPRHCRRGWHMILQQARRLTRPPTASSSRI